VPPAREAVLRGRRRSADPDQTFADLLWHCRVRAGCHCRKRNVSLSTLTRGHGVSDVTPAGSGVEALTLRFENAGTFQEFNDAIAPLGRIWYFDDNSMPGWFEKPFDLSVGLNGQQVTIKDVLSRMPDLSEAYSQTFGSPANATPIMLGFETHGGLCTLRIDDPYLFTDRASLVTSVEKWRAAHPFLNRWRFKEASHAWGFAILVFDNVDKGDDDDLSEENLVQGTNNGFAGGRATMGRAHRFLPAQEILPPLSGGYTHTSLICAMQPLAGAMLPDPSLQVLGSFLLSSLVRYRPQVWQNAISRSVTAQSPADDRALSLIEKFLDDVLARFPEMVVRVIDYQRIR
jgi:YaaC-like Protein